MIGGREGKAIARRQARFFRWVRRLVLLGLIALCAWVAYVFVKASPHDMPWTPLSLDRPIGLFTGRKLAALTQDRAGCMTLLRRSGLKFEAIEPHDGGGQCPVGDAVRVRTGQEMLALAPGNVAPSCPVVAALALWQWQVVAPAAHRHFGTSVIRISHLGSYACRRLYGRSTGDWSEHASADAIDVSGFVLADGREISVRKDWSSDGAEGRFLQEVRDGACTVFATVLSPDYNAQHADHFHLDQAERGAWGWRACR